MPVARILASADDGNVAANAIDGDLTTPKPEVTLSVPTLNEIFVQ